MKLERLVPQFAASPWPETDSEILFLLDAANNVEREILLNWIQQHRGDRPEPATVTLFLSNDHGLPPTHHLAKALKEHPSALVVPLRVSWLQSKKAFESGPRFRDWLSGNAQKPNQWRARRIVRAHPKRVALLTGAPATTIEMNERFEAKYHKNGFDSLDDLAVFVARQAAVVLDMSERQLTGGRYKVPRYVAESLRRNRDFKQKLREIGEERGVSQSQIHDEVNEYFKEMVSVPTPFWLDVFAKFASFCLSLGYDNKLNYREEDLERIRELVRKYPSALLWTHKTYLDGFVVPKIMFENDFPMPHMFGGANLNFPGLGFLMRHSGGIFIKRSFQDNEVYKATLRQYIGYLMEKRFPLTWSFEGTRQRIGKLMPPKYGLLKYVLEGCYNSGAHNIHIIPVAVTYDLIRDAEEYAREQSGVPKAPESLSWLIGYIRSLARPMGKIYVDFGEPVVLHEAPDPNDSLALSKIAFQVAVETNRVTPITLPAVASMALLGVYPRALTQKEIIQRIESILSIAHERNLRLSQDFDHDYAENIDNLLKLMIDEGIVTRFDGGPETVYGIIEGQAQVASYYRNSIVHYFVNRAIVELALVRVIEDTSAATVLMELFWQEVDELRDLFKFEFFYPTTAEFHEEIKAELGRISPYWEETLNTSRHEVRAMLLRIKPFVAHMTLTMFAESYAVSAEILAKHHGDNLSQEDCIDASMRYGKQAYLQRRITSEASIGKLLYSNAYKMLSARKLVDASLPEYRSARRAQSDQLNDLVRRIEVIRATDIATRGTSTTRDVVRGSI